MSELVIAGCTILGSYLIGAVPFGYLVARGRGVDILSQGSGNIGATNIGRVLGRRFGILVFLLDFTKGALPVAAATWIAAPWNGARVAGLGEDALPVMAGLAAFLGHLFPIYLRFRGGKGVATGAGVVAVLLPGPALGALLTWIIVVSMTRYVSLASLAAVVVLCVLRLGLTDGPLEASRCTLTLFCFLAAALVGVRHRANIRRLLQGTENRLRDTPAMLLFTRIIHVLSLSLWLGSTVFFSFVVAPVVFHSFEALADPSSPERAQLPLPDHFNVESSKQLAGAALRPVFPWYFLLQGVCGLMATATALSWSWAEPKHALHRMRSIILVVALATLVAAWPLAQHVNQVRRNRFSTDPTVSASARSSFASWHLYSLALDLGTLALVAVATALAAQMPMGRAERMALVDGRRTEEVLSPVAEKPS